MFLDVLAFVSTLARGRPSQRRFKAELVTPILNHVQAHPRACVFFHCVSGRSRSPVLWGWGDHHGM